MGDALADLALFADNEFELSIKFFKYDCCLNAPAAKVIVNFQSVIYKIAALQLKGKADARLLSNEQKQKLEIPFEISEGCTHERIKDFIPFLKELLKMIPLNQRAPTLVAIMFIFFAYLGYNNYLESNEKSLNHSTVDLAIEKMSSQYTELAGIVKNYDKNRLKDLSEIDDNVEFQGISYSKADLKTIKRKKYPRKIITSTSNINGVFTIVTIDLANNYLIAKDNTTQEDLKIYYAEANSLLFKMQEIADHLHEAIDNSNQLFYIEASVIKKNNKVDTRVLSKIFKHKNK